MTRSRALFLCGLLLAAAACASPDPLPGYGPFLEGYAVKEEVAPATFENTFVPDTLLPGEERFEVLVIPEPPADTEPPPGLEVEPVPPEQFPYGAWGSEGWGRAGRGGRPRSRK